MGKTGLYKVCMRYSIPLLPALETTFGLSEIAPLYKDFSEIPGIWVILFPSGDASKTIGTPLDLNVRISAQNALYICIYEYIFLFKYICYILRIDPILLKLSIILILSAFRVWVLHSDQVLGLGLHVNTKHNDSVLFASSIFASIKFTLNTDRVSPCF